MIHQCTCGAAERNLKSAPRILIADIVTAVASRFDFPVEALTGYGRSRGVTEARHLAMYLSCTLGGRSYEATAREFSGRHHTSIMHAMRAIGRRLSEQPEWREHERALRVEIRDIAGRRMMEMSA